MYKSILKPILFRMDAENAHHKVIGGMKLAARIPGGLSVLRSLYSVPHLKELQLNLWGIDFAHPIGLAAGLDKNGVATPAFSSAGFSFMEVGTVTPLGQPGNERPRLFRLPEDYALVNRMGFNNDGAEKMANELQKVKNTIPIAINIGKNKDTPNELAAEDYIKCMRELYTYGRFFVINISSPNTPGLRNLQHGEELKQLIVAVQNENKAQFKKHGGPKKPVLVKIAPDVTETELEYMVQSIVESGADGIIATNTTLDRTGLRSVHKEQAGGLSGKPLRERSTEVIRQMYQITRGDIPIIGCGGISTVDDAYEKIRAGANLIEIYTSLIYEGPGINRKLALGLKERLSNDGFKHISEAVGIDANQ